ncbi:MAG TPA: hypothetical protein VFP44_02865 [Usitatibacter sp.]|nr:hypothetical protein [Usitatibacter sp.]
MARWIPSTIALAGLLVFPASRAQADEPPAYEDKLIEGGNLAPETSGETAVYDPQGLPRSWRLDGFASRIESGDTRRYENGMLLSARIDTPAYGAISVDATVRSGRDSGVFTLWQRGMPFDNGWIANNALGTVNSPAIDLTRSQYRFFLPTFPLQGLTTEWLQLGRLQVNAALGEPGTYNGVRLAGFSRLGGTLASAGFQWNPDPRFRAGVQVVDARDVENGLDAASASATTSARAWYGAVGMNQPDDRLQLNALDSQAGSRRHNLGLWLDGESTRGRFRHNYGAFRFDPDLTWGYSPINRDLQGAYYRLNYASQQWTWSAGADSVGSVTGQGFDGLFLTGSVRYQVDRSLGVGGGGAARRSSLDGASAYLFMDKLTALGTTRVQLDAATAQGGQHSGQVSVDQSWPTRVGLRLSTTLSAGEDRTVERRTRRIGLAAFGGYDITNNLTVDGTLRWNIERDDGHHVGRFANVGLVWRISPRWSLVGTYYDNRVEIPQVFPGIAPLIPVEAVPIVPRDRAIFLTVRYEDHAGTAMAPLGGRPGAGAGTLVGYLFYDANDDGRRGANESGAANVTVVLDGRFAVRTDSEGRFEFPPVASGPHTLAVIPDNLALPYAVSEEGRREVVIRTRETTTIEIAAQRLK